MARLWLLVAFVFVFGAAAAEGPDEQAAREAKELFRVALASGPNSSESFSPQHCELSTTWYRESVPEFVARKYLHLRIHSDLLGREQKNPQDILDPERRFGEAFCSPEVAESYVDETLRKSESSADTICFRHYSFAFPVFDAGYHQAIFVFADSRTCHRDQSAVGGIRGYGHSIAFIFAKEKGVWKPVAEEILSQT